MLRLTTLFAICWIVTTVSITAGCGGSKPTGAENTPMVPTASQGAPGAFQLPAPESLAPRQVSATWQLDGAQFDPAAIAPSNLAVDGSVGVFSPEWDASANPALGDAAYGLYVFDLEGTQSGRFLSNTWDTPPVAGDCWVALANWYTGRWDWFEVAPGADLPVPEMLPYNIADNNVLVVVLVTGTAEARLTNLEFTGEPPDVRLTVDPAAGVFPLTADYDASASSSPNGSIDDYEWDFDGDLVFNEPGDEASARGNPIIQHTHNDFDTTRLRVTDNLGLTATLIHTVAFTTEAAGVEDLANLDAWDYIYGFQVDGRHALVYSPQIGPDQYKLKYQRAADEDGTTYGAPQVIADTGNQNPRLGLALIGGYPAIAYGSEVGVKEVRYRRALDVQGTAWGADQLVAPDWDGEAVQLLEVDGKPGVTAGVKQELVWVFDLKWFLGKDALGSGWETPVLIQAGDAEGGLVTGTSLVSLTSKPAVAYSFRDIIPGDDDAYTLRFALASDANGSAWGAPVDVLLSHTWNSWLHPTTPAPGINFWSDFSGEMECYWVEAADTAGTAWGAPQDVTQPPAKGGAAFHQASAHGDDTVHHSIASTISTPVGNWAINILACGLEGYDGIDRFMYAVYNSDTGKWEYFHLLSLYDDSVRPLDVIFTVKPGFAPGYADAPVFEVWIEVRWIHLVTHKVSVFKKQLGYVWATPDWCDTQHNRFQNFGADNGGTLSSISPEVH